MWILNQRPCVSVITVSEMGDLTLTHSHFHSPLIQWIPPHPHPLNKIQALHCISNPFKDNL